MVEAIAEAPPVLKLDLGCGPNKAEGFTGVDVLPFGGKVDVVADLKGPWPWADGSVDEVHCSHFLEHLEGIERVHFFNELWRVLKPGGTARIITPHWASCRAYGDVTHKWPPVSEFFYHYLSRDWRRTQAPHDDAQHVPGMYSCNFTHTIAYTVNGALHTKNQEFVMDALAWKKEAAQDTIAVVTKQP